MDRDKKAGERRREEEANVRAAEGMLRYHICKGREMENRKGRIKEGSGLV